MNATNRASSFEAVDKPFYRVSLPETREICRFSATKKPGSSKWPGLVQVKGSLPELFDVHAVGVIGHGARPIGEDTQNADLFGQYVEGFHRDPFVLAVFQDITQ